MSEETLILLLGVYLVGVPIVGLVAGYRCRSHWDAPLFIAMFWPVTLWPWLGEQIREWRDQE